MKIFKMLNAVARQYVIGQSLFTKSPRTNSLEPHIDGSIFRLDIDECHVKNGGCQGICHNLEGSFRCTCEEGYTISTTDSYACDGMLIINIQYKLSLHSKYNTIFLCNSDFFPSNFHTNMHVTQI